MFRFFKLKFHYSVQFSFIVSLLYCFPLIVRVFPFAKIYLQLCVSSFIDIKQCWYDCESFFFAFAFQFSQFVFLQKQFTISFHLMIVVRAESVLRDMQVMNPQFPFVKKTIRIGKISSSFPYRFYFGSAKH